MTCGLSFIVKNEEVLKVTGSHLYFKSGSISKTVLYTLSQNNDTDVTHCVIFLRQCRDIVTIGH